LVNVFLKDLITLKFPYTELRKEEFDCSLFTASNSLSIRLQSVHGSLLKKKNETGA